ncbi:upstream activation factor subunit UAF30 [Sporothrix schenckii 1099-18]|uniref:Uncharacterized protein n=2 Tax=Sporothrix schenckii TaxID=29908 RepID=U7PVE9_SPOS1|nr:upstream activation factor subunit UAF30 [Sporothrix schenckii 1099-18]ERS99633.1 hypothetical protein HMPREF1624_02993 [Sporothrix schenckii ATCC 58251]KJR86015.1 upstream activation factor subunit UAF30 [Sporothrix schenckii 1099-18]
MTTPLTDEEMRRYTQLVDAILATADLETVTRKKVRKALEKALGGKDLSDQKVAIKDLIEARFDAINSQSQSPDPAVNGGGSANGDEIKVSLEYDYDRSRPVAHDHDYDDEDEDGPAKKKHKRSSSSLEDADARLAAELQAQENRLARARTTRGGSASKSKPRKQAGSGSISKSKSKPSSKKSSAKIEDSDNDVGGDGDAPKEKRKASGGFQKPFNLSYQLGELVGVSQLSRPQVVKKLWEHIKGHELQDPQDKRQIRCDEKMQAVFKQQKIDMFQMNKLLSNHLYPVDEE